MAADELPASPSDDRPVLHPDARQLKALAHPLRSRLLGSLRVHGPATATQLAARLATNSGATSYHLRQLADVGVVEDDVERSTGRDRVWRSTHRSTSWRSPEFDDDPDARAADEWLMRHHANTMSRWLDDWLDARQEWPKEWREAADQSDYHVRLSAERLNDLMAELHAVVSRYVATDDPTAPGAQLVTVLLQAFPSPDRQP
ncbi:MAG: helix-turn-helix domain-containing protein [Ilumatobacteraceae bacterium]